MNTIFKSILIGILLGLLAFLAGKFLVILLIIGAIFKLSGKGKWKKEQWKSHRLAYAEKIRSMDNEDYESFKSNIGKNFCHPYNNQNK